LFEDKVLITRKLTDNEIKILINNYFLPSLDELYNFLIDTSNVMEINELVGKKTAEASNIEYEINEIKHKDREQYQFDMEYISNTDLYKKYNVYFDIPADANDTTTMSARLLYNGKNQLWNSDIYNLGRIPRPLTSDPYNANGIRVLFKSPNYYLNIRDLVNKGLLTL